MKNIKTGLTCKLGQATTAYLSGVFFFFLINDISVCEEANCFLFCSLTETATNTAMDKIPLRYYIYLGVSGALLLL